MSDPVNIKNQTNREIYLNIPGFMTDQLLHITEDIDFSSGDLPSYPAVALIISDADPAPSEFLGALDPTLTINSFSIDTGIDTTFS